MINNFLQHSLFPPTNFMPQTSTLTNSIVIKHHAIGIIEIIPIKASHAMVISSGIHGNETAAIELVDAIVNSILSGEVAPRSCHALFIIAHPTSIHKHQRFIDENLNRLFTDKLLLDEGEIAEIESCERYNQEQKIAKKLQFYLHKFYSSLPQHIPVWHLDLHCTIRTSQHKKFAIIPNSAYKHKQQLCHFFQASKLNAVLMSQSPSYTFSWWSGQYYNAIAATIELGQVSPLYQNNLSEYKKFHEALLSLLCNKPLPASNNKHSLTRYLVSRTLYRQSEDFFFAFANEIPNFTFFSEGQLIAKENGIDIRANQNGEAVVFPNPTVQLGQRAALLVKISNK